MNEQQQELGRRAVACKRWRWMPGMLTTDNNRVCYTRDYGVYAWDEYDNACADCAGGIVQLSTVCLPDLTDPATLGCLLALVREAWPKAPATTDRHGTWKELNGHHYIWTCSYCTGRDWRQATGTCEAEALVDALEAAP